MESEDLQLAIRSEAQIPSAPLESDEPDPDPEYMWDNKRTANFLANLCRTRHIKKELEDKSLLLGARAFPVPPAEIEKPAREVPWHQRYKLLMWLCFRRDVFPLAGMFVLGVMHVLSGLAFLLTMTLLVDDLSTPTVDGKAGEVTTVYIGSLFLAGGVCAAVLMAKTILFDVLGARFQSRLQETLLQMVCHRPMHWLDKQSTETLVATLGPTAETVRESFYQAQVSCVWSVEMMILGLTMLALASWPLMVVTLVGGPPLVGASRLYAGYMAADFKRYEDRKGTSQQAANEFIREMRWLRVYGMESAELREYAAYSKRSQAVFERLATFNAAYRGTMLVVWAALTCMVMGILGGHMQHMETSVGFLVSAYLAFLFTLFYTQELLQNLTKLRSGYEACLRCWPLLNLDALTLSVGELLDLGPATQLTLHTKLGPLVQHWDEDGARDEHGIPPDFAADKKGFLSFQKLTFAYPTRPGYKVLNSFTMDVPSGKVVGLTGQHGGGKSTLAALVMRRYKAEAGVIAIDGVDIHDYDRTFHNQVGYMCAEPVLFAGSIRDNIAFGLNNRATGEQGLHLDYVTQAARLADAHQLISLLPEKYNTRVGPGPGGCSLPAGMAMRIVLARTLARDPAVLVLDDCVPHPTPPQPRTPGTVPDPHSEGRCGPHKTLRAALRRAMRFPLHRTGIVMSHHWEDLEWCDFMGCLEGGVLVEYGACGEILKNPESRFHLLINHALAGDPNANILTQSIHGRATLPPVDPMHNMIISPNVFKHPIAVGKHNSVHPQPDYV